MESLIAVSPQVLGFAVIVTLVASFVKGAIGFAMPMVMISGLASVLPADAALAAVIVPTLVANVFQALRGDGLSGVRQILRDYWVFMTCLTVFIMVAAQLFTLVPERVLFVILALPIIVFAITQLLGWQPRIAPAHRARAQFGFGTVAGVSGGLTGLWGPPTIMYLAAIDAPKAEVIRFLGVVFFAGVVVLMIAHIRSGVLNAQTAPLSIVLLAPMAVGMACGLMVQDRLDQARFRKAMLFVLIVVGLNLLRRGFTG